LACPTVLLLLRGTAVLLPKAGALLRRAERWAHAGRPAPLRSGRVAGRWREELTNGSEL
jgi:hypothetical protein